MAEKNSDPANYSADAFSNSSQQQYVRSWTGNEEFVAMLENH